MPSFDRRGIFKRAGDAARTGRRIVSAPPLPGAGVDNILLDDGNLDNLLLDDTNTDVALLQDFIETDPEFATVALLIDWAGADGATAYGISDRSRCQLSTPDSLPPLPAGSRRRVYRSAPKRPGAL